jgi:arginine deiminase
MHLDTVFTQMDVDCFTYYPDIMRDDIACWELTPGDNEEIIFTTVKDGFVKSIARTLDLQGDHFGRLTGLKQAASEVLNTLGRRAFRHADQYCTLADHQYVTTFNCGQFGSARVQYWSACRNARRPKVLSTSLAACLRPVKRPK